MRDGPVRRAVKFVGLGETMEAIEPFNPADFIEAMFAE